MKIGHEITETKKEGTDLGVFFFTKSLLFITFGYTTSEPQINALKPNLNLNHIAPNTKLLFQYKNIRFHSKKLKLKH